MNENQGLFDVLGMSLEEYRAAVESEPGTKVASMGADEGVLPDVIRSTVAAIADVLDWLHRLSEDIRPYVLVGDAVVALFEVGASAMLSLDGGVQIGPLAEQANVPTGAIDGVNSAIQAGQDALAFAQKMASSVIPPLEDINRIHSELVALLGERSAPPLQKTGSMTQLMNHIGL